MEVLSELDWNFDRVPDNELAACCYWEYARESCFIRGVRNRCLEAEHAVGQTRMRLHQDLRKLQSIGYPSEVFLRGFFFAPEDPHQNRHRDASPVTGKFPEPWQKFSKEERAYRAHISNDIERVPLEAFKRGSSSDLKDISYILGLPGKDGKADFTNNQPSAFWVSGTEVTVVSIAWAVFTNDEITNYFKRWVKINRPKDLPAPSGRGHKLKDWRVRLTCLAVMRLLARATVSEIMVNSANKFAEVWAAKQFLGRKWLDTTKWYDARRQCGLLFHRLLPFLPESEKPISWQRRPPIK